MNPRIATKSPYARYNATKTFYNLIELLYYGETEHDMKGVYQALVKFYEKATGSLLEDNMLIELDSTLSPSSDTLELSDIKAL